MIIHFYVQASPSLKRSVSPLQEHRGCFRAAGFLCLYVLEAIHEQLRLTLMVYFQCVSQTSSAGGLIHHNDLIPGILSSYATQEKPLNTVNIPGRLKRSK